jgi:hypothetical protein
MTDTVRPTSIIVTATASRIEPNWLTQFDRQQFGAILLLRAIASSVRCRNSFLGRQMRSP